MDYFIINKYFSQEYHKTLNKPFQMLIIVLLKADIWHSMPLQRVPGDTDEIGRDCFCVFNLFQESLLKWDLSGDEEKAKEFIP